MTQSIYIHIPDEMAEAISLIAQAEDATAGEVIRDAIWRDMRQRTLSIEGETPLQRAYDPLRLLLQDDFDQAQNWPHLRSLLQDKGLQLLQGQHDLMIHRTSGEQICRLSDIGQNRVALNRRFDAAFCDQSDHGPQALAG